MRKNRLIKAADGGKFLVHWIDDDDEWWVQIDGEDGAGGKATTFVTLADIVTLVNHEDVRGLVLNLGSELGLAINLTHDDSQPQEPAIHDFYSSQQMEQQRLERDFR